MSACPGISGLPLEVLDETLGIVSAKSSTTMNPLATVTRPIISTGTMVSSYHAAVPGAGAPLPSQQSCAPDRDGSAAGRRNWSSGPAQYYLKAVESPEPYQQFFRTPRAERCSLQANMLPVGSLCPTTDLNGWSRLRTSCSGWPMAIF